MTSSILIDILNFALPLLYLTVVWVYGKAFFSDAAWAKRIKTRLFVSTLAVHFVYLLLRTVEFRHPPVTSIFELLTAPPEKIRSSVVRILEKYGMGSGHIFNLGHGILPDIRPDHAKAFIQAVKEESIRFHK